MSSSRSRRRKNPLFGRDNVVATPHLGAATTEAQENVALQIAEQMADFLLTGAVSNAVNMPSLTAEEATRLRPYMKLAEQLGSFAGQLTESGITAVAIEYEGAIAELNVKPLTAIVLTGLLAPQLATVNMVNAPVICRERDIRVSETRRAEPGDYQNLMRVVVTDDRRRAPPARGCRHLVRRRQAAPRRGRGHPARGRTRRQHAVRAQYRQAGLYRRARPTRWAPRRSISRPSTSAAPLPGQDAICLIEVDQPLTPALLDTVRGSAQCDPGQGDAVLRLSPSRFSVCSAPG